MTFKKLLTAAAVATIFAVTACADVAGPGDQKNGVCPVSGSGQTCDDGS